MMTKIFAAIGGLVFLIAVILFFNSFATIDTGSVGIKKSLGAVVGTVQPGFYFLNPFTDRVEEMDVQTQKEQADSAASSADLQTVKTTVAVNYNIDATHAADLYSKVGKDYSVKIIDPAIQETVKAVTAKYTAEQLITKRAEVTDAIQTALVNKLGASDIKVTGVSIVNFDFSAQFNNAIEAKVTAEQNALAAKNKLDQVKYEADQAVATAKGQAEAIKIQAEAINSQGGADYVQLQAIKAWDGKLPNQMIPGQTLPFINIGQK